MATLISRDRRSLFLIALVLASVATVFAAVAFAGNGETSRSEGSRVGEARKSGGQQVVASVNEQAIIAADIQEGKAQVAVNLDRMRATIDRISQEDQLIGEQPAPGQVVIDEGDHTPIPESSGLRENFSARIALIEEHGADAVVFAQLINDLAIFSAASEAGHAAAPSDVASRVEEAKAAVAEGRAPEIEGYISAVGEHAFWSEIFPDRAAREMTIVNWRVDVFDGIETSEALQAWRGLERAAVASATINVTGALGLNAKADEALAYLDAYWSLTAR